MVIDGACAPSYLEVWLAPLEAYTLLVAAGMPTHCESFGPALGSPRYLVSRERRSIIRLRDDFAS